MAGLIVFWAVNGGSYGAIVKGTQVCRRDCMEALADGDDLEMPSPIHTDFENGFNNVNSTGDC